MQQANPISTTQHDVHEKLIELVERYKHSEFKRPIQTHTQLVFEEINTWLSDWHGEVILDSCCGVGESTASLANRYPEARIIGVDKSAARLDKHHAYKPVTLNTPANYRIWRADVNDLWRLLAGSDLRFARHCIFYPNPYPKPAQIQKRWYASAVMPALMKLSPIIEVRSNWRLYLQEFAIAAASYNYKSDLVEVCTDKPFTPFERKYLASGQPCYSLQLEQVL